MVLQSDTSADPSIGPNKRGSGIAAFYSLTNDLKTSGFRRGLESFKSGFLNVLNVPLPFPPRLTTDLDLTILKSLMDLYRLEGGYDYKAYCRHIWKLVRIVQYTCILSQLCTSPPPIVS
jgi:hypothetical protein